MHLGLVEKINPDLGKIGNRYQTEYNLSAGDTTYEN